MKWPKDRKRAFLWVAEAFGTPYAERTERQKELTSGGFCLAVFELTKSKSIYDWIYAFGDLAGIGDDYWWPIKDWPDWTPSCDDERSFFCCLMAALSDKEFEELAEKNS